MKRKISRRQSKKDDAQAPGSKLNVAICFFLLHFGRPVVLRVILKSFVHPFAAMRLRYVSKGGQAEFHVGVERKVMQSDASVNYFLLASEKQVL